MLATGCKERGLPSTPAQDDYNITDQEKQPGKVGQAHLNSCSLLSVNHVIIAGCYDQPTRKVCKTLGLSNLLDPSSLLTMGILILTSMPVHEWAHAWAAYQLGDDTAALRGRLTINPLAHLDPVGTITLLLFRFGWGKPVPVNPFNLGNPKRDDVIISIAGPASNIATAIVIGLFLRFLPWETMLNPGAVGSFGAKFSLNMVMMLWVGLRINLGLAVFNMLPLFPLDGSHVVKGLLPQEQSYAFERFSRYAPGILIGLILFEHVLDKPLLTAIIRPPIVFLARLIVGPNFGL